MNIAQVSLEIALQAKPTWTGVATHTDNTATLTDTTLARSGETFAGGTLWALGKDGPVVYRVKSHNSTQIILETNATPAIVNYIVSPIPFAELLRTINAALSREREMVYEEIVIDTINTPSRYTLTNAQDIRRVEIIPIDTTVALSRHHYWREEGTKIYFYSSTPAVEGHIRAWYPAHVTMKTAGSDLLPANLRKELFINNCLQLMYRMGIQKVGKDGPSNYDLINEAKDLGDKIAMKGLTLSNTLWDYDPRFRA